MHVVVRGLGASVRANHRVAAIAPCGAKPPPFHSTKPSRLGDTDGLRSPDCRINMAEMPGISTARPVVHPPALPALTHPIDVHPCQTFPQHHAAAAPPELPRAPVGPR